MVQDRNRRARDTAVGVYDRHLNPFGRTCAGKFFRFEHADIPFVRHSDEVECVRLLSDWFQKSTDAGTPNLACWCLRMPFNSYYLGRDAERYEHELDLEVHQRTKDHGFLSGGIISSFFAVRPAKFSLFYGSVSEF